MYKVTPFICKHACVPARELQDLSFEEIALLKQQVREVFYAKKALLHSAKMPRVPLPEKPAAMSNQKPMFKTHKMVTTSQLEETDLCDEPVKKPSKKQASQAKQNGPDLQEI